MAKIPSEMSGIDLMKCTAVMVACIKRNAVRLGRYGLDEPDFSDQLYADIMQVNSINRDRERLKDELKSKTNELNQLMQRIELSYSLAIKTVKMAEPKKNWVAYGISDTK